MAKDGANIDGATGSILHRKYYCWKPRQLYRGCKQLCRSVTSAVAVLTLTAVNPLVNTAGNPTDFNGDGKSDILLSNALTGDRVIWLMNGTAIGTNAFAGNVPVEWSASAMNDFSGDGKADIFWTNKLTGDRAMWLMNGSTLVAGAYLGAVPVEWVISATGDFNGREG